MLFQSISVILLLIHLSSTFESPKVKCVGQNTTLSCVKLSDAEKEINTLWKKRSGERVIWKINGNIGTGPAFTDRQISINGDLSLNIVGCAQSDEGVYVLCINGQPTCEVRLFVKASDEKMCKNSEAEQKSSPRVAPESTNEYDVPLSSYKRWVIFTGFIVVGLLISLAVLRSYCNKKKLYKIKASESKMLNDNAETV